MSDDQGGGMPNKEALLAASEPAAWERSKAQIPSSYVTSYMRRMHRAGFNAGLRFARLALDAATEPGQD